MGILDRKTGTPNQTGGKKTYKKELIYQKVNKLN